MQRSYSMFIKYYQAGTSIFGDAPFITITSLIILNTTVFVEAVIFVLFPVLLPALLSVLFPIA